MLSLVFVFSCSEEEENIVIKDLTLEKTEVKAYVSKDVFVTINRGSGKYKVEGKVDATKLKAVVEGEKLKLTGVAVTETPIDVVVVDTDTNKKVTIKVTVAEVVKLVLKESDSSFMPLTEKKSVGVGADAFVRILTGNGDYVIASVEGVTTEIVEKTYKQMNKDTYQFEDVKGEAIKITGKAKGTYELTITDGAGETTKLTVNVFDKITLAEKTKDITACGEVTVDISSGSGSYSASVDGENTSFIQTKVKDGKVVLIPRTNAENPIKVTIRDDETELTEELTVTIKITDVEEDASFYVTCTGELNKKVGATATGDVVVLEGATAVPYPAFGKDYARPFVDNKTITSIDFNNVESIAAGALQGCTGLTKITLRKVAIIESLFGAFGAETYPDLKSIYCHMNPAETKITDKNGNYLNSFNKVPQDAILYVPAKYLEAYKASDFNKYFDKDTRIKPIQ